MTDDSAAPKRRPGRPTREAGDASLLIRRAALREFARAGFDGVSIVEIAEAAGVARPLIHYHFASKEALWQAAFSEGFEALQRDLTAFRATLAVGSGPDTLRLIAHQLVRYAARYPELSRIVIDETGRGGERADWLMQNFLLPGYRLAQLALASFRSLSPQPPAIPPAEHVIPVLLGIMNFPFLETRVVQEAFGVDVHGEAYLQQHGEILFRVMQALV